MAEWIRCDGAAGSGKAHLAMEKTAVPLSALMDLMFSFRSSSASARAGRATALS